MRILLTFGTLLLLTISLPIIASERDTARYFEKIKADPVLLRQFLYRFPKGGDIHNHIDGSIYAENLIAWSADDGRCVNLNSMVISLAPCDAKKNRPRVADIENNPEAVNKIIDAFSVRNYRLGDKSGNDQFFSSFGKFFVATLGREGDMLDEVTRRAANQNTYYLELMQSWNMGLARATVGQIEQQNKLIAEIADKTGAMIDGIEAKRRVLQNCDEGSPVAACQVQVRYLAQVLRNFPREQVRAQTKLAVRLMQQDPRVVGLNFVAPEHDPISLRDYRWHMEMIAEEAAVLPADKRNIALHAGELTLGLVAPEELGFHIRDAIEVAGAKRIGHAIDIVHDTKALQLVKHMAAARIAVEINLTSNDVILEVSGDRHPFNFFRNNNVPLTLSTDDEGVSRIDLTHEYQRAVETYDLTYQDLKQFARNALEYSFLEGSSLFLPDGSKRIVEKCRRVKSKAAETDSVCVSFLADNAKARAQQALEDRINIFESSY